MKIVVTGGSGFIGQHVCRTLREHGAEVLSVDLNPTSSLSQGVEETVGDLRNPDVVTNVVSPSVDGIIHLAALTSVVKSMENPVGVYESNVAVTQSLLECARQAKVRSVVMASTNAVTGDVGDALISETMALAPLTPYGATKAAGEMLLSAYGASYGLGTTALRLTNVYGAGMQVKDSIVARMMRCALTGATFQIYGDGTQVRDYIYVTDVARAFVDALDWTGQNTVIIGQGSSISVNDLYEMVCSVTGVAFGVEHVPAKAGEMPAVVVDTQRATSKGFVPRYSLEEGLEATWRDFLATHAP